MKIKNHNFIIAIILIMVTLNSVYIFAQQLNVKASFDGLPISASYYSRGDLNVNSGFGLLDFNRDGVPDRPFIDSKNERLVILSGSDKEKWIIPLSNFQYRIEQGRITRICGFYEIDGDPSTTEIVIAQQEGNRFWSPVILLLDKSSTKLQDDNSLAQPNYFLLGINDIDQDGKDDIVVADTTVKKIEVLGY
jgi:hypothetical protein